MKKAVKAILCVLIAFLVFANTGLTVTYAKESTEEKTDSTAAVFSGRQETIYANLLMNGTPQKINAVTEFTVSKEGLLSDFGDYSELINLTNATEISYSGGVAEMYAEKGKFYYQGTLEKNELPWNFSVSYYLNGSEITPRNIAGESGKTEIKISVKKNPNESDVYFENYMLQISADLDSSVFSDIKAENASISNSGKNKTVTFTLLPNKEGEFSLSAKAEGFSFEGITIAAVPYSSFIDIPSFGEYTKSLETLVASVEALSDGIGESAGGSGALSEGLSSKLPALQSGSDSVQNLISAYDSIYENSSAIKEQLKAVCDSLNNDTTFSETLSGFSSLSGNLRLFASGLSETAKSIREYKALYSGAVSSLDSGIMNLQGENISEEDLAALKHSAGEENEQLLTLLIDGYEKAAALKQLYTYKSSEDENSISLREVFAGVPDTLEAFAVDIDTISDNLITAAEKTDDVLSNSGLNEKISELTSGFTSLYNGYDLFDSGLSEYTSGTKALAYEFSSLGGSLTDLGNGLQTLSSGIKQLYEGSTKLLNAVSELPERVEAEITALTDNFSAKDFIAQSYVSDKNSKTDFVQFVMKTESIKKQENEAPKEEESTESSFFEKLLDLFR